MYIYYRMVDSSNKGERLDHSIMVQGKLANNEEQKLDSHHIDTLIIKKNPEGLKLFNKPIQVLKNIGQTLSTTVREGLPKHISMDRNHKCSHNSDYVTI